MRQNTEKRHHLQRYGGCIRRHVATPYHRKRREFIVSYTYSIKRPIARLGWLLSPTRDDDRQAFHMTKAQYDWRQTLLPAPNCPAIRSGFHLISTNRFMYGFPINGTACQYEQSHRTTERKLQGLFS